MKGELLRFIGIALAAALIGSLGGGLLYTAYEVSRSSADLDLAAIPAFFGFVLLASFSGLVIAIPGALLVGVPLTWPFRRLIAVYPLPALLLYGPVGAAAGWGLNHWIDTSALPGRYDLPGAIFGGTVAAAFVLLIRARRPAEA